MIPFPCHTTVLSLLMGFVGLPSVVHAQTADFNDGNDIGWTHDDPLGGLFGEPVVTFAVTNGQYRISSAVSPNPGAAGPARGASLRQDKTYSRFCVSVDSVGIPQLPEGFFRLALPGTP